MKKWLFWSIMALTALVNGALFYGNSRLAMERGIQGADNQAALLFIPVLWIAAAAAVAAILLSTLACGRRITGGIRLLELFRLAPLGRRERHRRIAFFALVLLLMVFGYYLFNDGVLSAAYALSGGLLVLLLHTWRKAGEKTA